MSACQVPSGLWQEDCWGALRSTFSPVKGPAVAQWVALSQTSRLFVEAASVSVPGATEVVRSKLASPLFNRPDPVPSVAVQLTTTSPPCQVVGGVPQVMTGFFLSTLFPETGPTVEEFSTLSRTVRLSVEALESSVSLPTLVVRLKLASPLSFSPEPLSEAVQAMATSAPCHIASAAPHNTTGALRSTLLPEMSAGEAAQLPAASQALSVPAEAAALPFSDPLPTAVDRDTSWAAGPDPPSV